MNYKSFNGTEFLSIEDMSNYEEKLLKTDIYQLDISTIQSYLNKFFEGNYKPLTYNKYDKKNINWDINIIVRIDIDENTRIDIIIKLPKEIKLDDLLFYIHQEIDKYYERLTE